MVMLWAVDASSTVACGNGVGEHGLAVGLGRYLCLYCRILGCSSTARLLTLHGEAPLDQGSGVLA